MYVGYVAISGEQHGTGSGVPIRTASGEPAMVWMFEVISMEPAEILMLCLCLFQVNNMEPVVWSMWLFEVNNIEKMVMSM